jgi:hypothetical protein
MATVSIVSHDDDASDAPEPGGLPAAGAGLLSALEYSMRGHPEPEST